MALTLRRLLFALVVTSSSGWSQPTAPQARTPIVVQVEMPPTNFWTHFAELVIPAVIGAAVAFFGVWLTNRTNERTNTQTRKHQLDLERVKDQIAAEAASRDNRWAFRKDVYSDLIKTISSVLLLLNDSLAINRNYLAGAENLPLPEVAVKNPPHVQSVRDQLQEYAPRFRAAVVNYYHFANLSRLATADWLAQRILTLTPVLSPPSELSLLSPDYAQTVVPLINRYNDVLKVVVEAGRKDLWEMSEPDTDAGAATQTAPVKLRI